MSMLQIIFIAVLSTFVESLRLSLSKPHLQRGEFVPTFGDSAVFGEGGHLGVAGNTSSYRVCEADEYISSPLENEFRENINTWASSKKNQHALCAHIGDRALAWIDQNKGKAPASNEIFSLMCKKGQYPQLIEPLAGILRDPRFPCYGAQPELLFSIEWLLMADKSVVQPNGMKFFFDAGATHFTDALKFFVSHYESRGILFDHIYVWEATKQTYENYWKGVSDAVRQKWEPRVTFYNGVPVSAQPGHENNVVDLIHKMCRAEDFCAFKLDIDTPSVELPLVQQLLAKPEQTSIALNEFFFEHHVHGIMQSYGWNEVNGTFADSIDIFTRLRQMGVRCHSWI